MKKIVIFPIKIYKRYISPYLPCSCKYYPTCSIYTMTAIDKHGIIKGLIMGFFRILRCNPFVKGGFDYVPDKFSIKRNKDRKYDILDEE